MEQGDSVGLSLHLSRLFFKLISTALAKLEDLGDMLMPCCLGLLLFLDRFEMGMVPVGRATNQVSKRERERGGGREGVAESTKGNAGARSHRSWSRKASSCRPTSLWGGSHGVAERSLRCGV